jgi:DNA-binding CsgD family transcriptional regulator/tetratricopeptide (TPR) repeat protein
VLSDPDPGRAGIAAGLVGRDEDLERVCSFLESAAAGGAALLLVGEPGVGKSVLVDVGVAEASERGMLVLRAGGAEFEADVSFSGLNQVLIPLLGEFGRLPEAHRAALSVALGMEEGRTPDRLVVSSATLGLLRAVAAQRAVLVAVDDVHWMDRASAAVLAFVARRLAGSRVGFLAASRPGMESFFEGAGLPEHELRPLDDDAALALMGYRFPALGPKVRRRVLAEARGNPLALLELPAALTGPQRPALRALPAVLPLSRRLQALFVSRISELPAASRQLLLLGALDSTADLRVLKAATSEPDDEDPLAPAEHALLLHVEESTGRLTFRHPLTRSAVVELSTADQRRRAHMTLADMSQRPEHRAWHLGEATIEPDERVAGLLEEAADRILGRGDPAGAVAALSRAAQLSPLRSDRSRRLAEAAYVGLETGDMEVASQLLGDARRADPAHGGGSLYAAATAAYLLSVGDNDVETAHRLLARAIETRTDPDDGALVEAVWTLLLLCWFGGEAEMWKPFHAAVADLGSRLPPDLALMSATFPDPVRTAGPVLDQLNSAINGLRNEVDPVRIARICHSAVNVDRLAGCRDALWRVVARAREVGPFPLAVVALIHLCLDDYISGRWDQISELADEGLETGDAQGYRHFAWPFHYFLALVAAARGDQDTARAQIDKALQWATPRGARGVQHYVHHAQAVAALARSDFEDAYRHAVAISPAGEFASHVPTALWAMMDLVEAAVRTDRRAEAAAHVKAMEQAKVAELSPRMALLATGSAAMAADDESAGELFEKALAVPGADRWPFEAARVRLAYGEQLRRARATSEARVQLTGALETFERLGARPWMDRAGHELRAAGLGTAHGSGAGVLTPQEREIAVLAAAGLSNKEIGQQLFLSHRTVGAHLYRAFPKLGITSRAALRDALATLPIGPGKG